MQRQPLPQEKHPLALDPILTFPSQRDQIELAQQGDYDHPHLDPCQTATEKAHVSMLEIRKRRPKGALERKVGHLPLPQTIPRPNAKRPKNLSIVVAELGGCIF
jgi:hypothetical protein